MQIGVKGFEPSATRSQSECSTKLSYTPLTMHLSVCYVGATPNILTVYTGVGREPREHPKGVNSQLPGFGISEPLGTFGWNVSSPRCTNYSRSLVFQQVLNLLSCIL